MKIEVAYINSNFNRKLFILFFVYTFFNLTIVSKSFGENTLENTLYLELKDGRVVIETLPDLAPNHVERIKKLAKEKFYDNSPIHRVIEGFMAQMGDPLYRHQVHNPLTYRL